MKKQHSIKVQDLKARKDVKGGGGSKPNNKLQPTGGSKPTGGKYNPDKVNL